MAIPEGENQTIGNSTFQIGKSKAVQIPMSGEQELQFVTLVLTTLFTVT